MSAVLVAACVALLAAACGASPGSHVAQLGSSTNQSSANPSAATAQQEGPLAFSRCMRSHGVADFPDPNSSGVLPKSQLEQIAASDPRYPAAQTTCGNLVPSGALPPGGQPTQAELRQMESHALNFARCMRSRGVPEWPDYTLRGGIPIFDLHGTGIDPNSPQIVTKQLGCKSLLHLPYSPPTSGGV